MEPTSFGLSTVEKVGWLWRYPLHQPKGEQVAGYGAVVDVAGDGDRGSWQSIGTLPAKVMERTAADMKAWAHFAGLLVAFDTQPICR